MTAPNCLELFAGAGGAALGLRAAGLSGDCYELDASAVATLKAAGFRATQQDVRQLDGQAWAKEHGSPFLLWASPPCQAFSTAGARLGAMDDRNGWPWTLDVIDATGPRWAVCENVPGLTQHSGEHCGDPMRCPGCYWLRVVVPAFRARFAWVGVWMLNAADMGVPQTRRRVFLVAGPHAVKPPTPTHAAPHLCQGLFGTLKPWVSIGEALGLVGTTDEPAPILGGGGNQMIVETARTRGSGVRYEQSGINEPSPAIRGAAGGSTRPMLRVIGGGRNPTSDPKDKRTYRDLTNEPSTTVAAVQIGNAGPWVVPAKDAHLFGSRPDLADRPAMPVLARAVKGRAGLVNRHDPSGVQDQAWLIGRRRLTVAECATLQGFPPGHPFQGNQSAQYRQVGNAVCPAVAEAIGTAILASALHTRVQRGIVSGQGEPT